MSKKDQIAYNAIATVDRTDQTPAEAKLDAPPSEQSSPASPAAVDLRHVESLSDHDRLVRLEHHVAELAQRMFMGNVPVGLR